jgi:hypothetical protein
MWLGHNERRVYMAILYTPEDISKVLLELRIDPVEGKVDANEAARILSWRAKAEQGLDYEYASDAIRQHVRANRFEAGSIDRNKRGSRYPVDQVFKLPIVPKRRMGRKPVRKNAAEVKQREEIA